MNKRIKKLWIKALGRYKQGTNSLHPDAETFCCLGVLCDLYGKKHKVGWQLRNDQFRFLGRGGALPSVVMQWEGLNDNDPILGNRENSPSASYLNDSGKTFNYIAARIEKYL